MPKYDVWFTVRGTKNALKDTVSAKTKADVERGIRSIWYGENPQIQQVKLHKK